VGTLISLYVTAVLLRLLLQWVRADFYNPLCQFLVKVTNPVLVPLRRVVPAIGRLDTASVVLMLVLEIFGIWLVSQIGSTAISVQQLLAFGAIKLVMTVLMTYFFLIIASVIISWIGQRTHHPLVPLIYQLTEPVLRPFRKFIPPIAGLDLSPLFALIAIRFLIVLLGW
jgi:YggT family protein